MLKNKNIRFGFFVFLITLLGLVLYAEYSTPTEEISHLNEEESRDFVSKP